MQVGSVVDLLTLSGGLPCLPRVSRISGCGVSGDNFDAHLSAGFRLVIAVKSIWIVTVCENGMAAIRRTCWPKARRIPEFPRNF